MPRSPKHVLVTGGAGYIGSHTAKALSQAGWTPVTYDNLYYGHSWAVKWGPLVEGDIGDRAKLLEVFRRYDIGAVIHLAAFAYVGESMEVPERYYDNNVGKSLILLEAAREAGVRHVVFSSSCTIYGTPERMPIVEDTPRRPVSPYAETKLVFERALHWYGQAHGITAVSLRYFNASGADEDGELGEDHTPETHLIPLALEAARGWRTLRINGIDYPTRDGTCERDYTHVMDLASGHVRALRYLLDGGASVTVNLGTGQGHTVKEVVSAVERVTGRPVKCQSAPRRGGDAAVLVADATRAGTVLGWRPVKSSLDNIIGSAWSWHLSHFSDTGR